MLFPNDVCWLPWWVLKTRNVNWLICLIDWLIDWVSTIFAPLWCRCWKRCWSVCRTLKTRCGHVQSLPSVKQLWLFLRWAPVPNSDRRWIKVGPILLLHWGVQHQWFAQNTGGMLAEIWLVLHASGCCCESALELLCWCMTIQQHPAGQMHELLAKGLCLCMRDKLLRCCYPLIGEVCLLLQML